jgi:NAD-dependent deacetylase
MRTKTPSAADVAEIIKDSKALVAFTGAGISTAAGVPDFRGKNGIYTTGAYPPDVFDSDAFFRDPRGFYRYARDFLALEKTLTPTFTHRFLAGLEKDGKLQRIITQNIDGLHQKADSTHVLELHGGYGTSRCTGCAAVYTLGQLREKMSQTEVPHCDRCRGVIKPDIVFFGEPVKDFDEAERIVAAADTLLVIGTSLAVYPAAFLPRLVKGTVIAVNRGAVNLSGSPALSIDADIDRFFREVAVSREKQSG